MAADLHATKIGRLDEPAGVVSALILNYRTADSSQACIEALLPELSAGASVFLLDNGSGREDAEQLTTFAAVSMPRVRFSASETNLGFAGGMNRLIGEALADPGVDQILLLNSDTLPKPGFISALQASLDPATCIDMAAARMLDGKSGNVDSLGITLVSFHTSLQPQARG